jgi:hypothetical protein
MDFYLIGNLPAWQITAEVCLLDGGPMLVFHCRVYEKWTKTLRLELRDAISAFLAVHRRPVAVAYFPDESLKIKKFAALMGFVPWKPATAADGRPVLLMRR